MELTFELSEVERRIKGFSGFLIFYETLYSVMAYRLIIHVRKMSQKKICKKCNIYTHLVDIIKLLDLGILLTYVFVFCHWLYCIGTHGRMR